eukprot:2588449-Alexandrium_andersonii.AAC.1
MLASPEALKKVSKRALRSSEWRAPAAGRRSRARVRFKHPAVCPCSSSVAWVMFARRRVWAALALGGGRATSCGARGVTRGL